MNTKEVCKKLNVTPKMLRIYEENGLIKPSRRENNYRDYSAENLLQIETVAVLRGLGFSIPEIKKMLTFDRTENENMDMFYLQYKALDSQIDRLQQTKEELQDAINKLLDSCNTQSLADILRSDEKKSQKRIDYDDMVTEWDFDKMASDFVNKYLSSDIPYINTVKRLKDIIETKKGSSFIDIGCGTCNLWQGSPPDINLLAVDLSLPMLLESRKRLPWISIRLDNIITMNTREYDIYDVVVSSFTIHHIPPENQYRAVDNILALCRKGGMALIADRCFKSAEHRRSRERMLMDKNDMQALEYMNSEYFIHADELEAYLKIKANKVITEYTDDNMVIYIVSK